jgi:integrase/recombinase XerC/integrase/recombinase XerD
MLDSGLRFSEVLRLEHGKIHLEAGYLIALGKGNKERFVPLGLNTKKYLIKYLAHLPNTTPKARLVVKDMMTPAKESTLQNLFRRLKKRSDIPRLRAHLLRHTFATRYLSLGGDVYSLQAILGHTTLEMTKLYSKLIPMETVVNFTRYSPVDNILKNPQNP